MKINILFFSQQNLKYFDVDDEFIFLVDFEKFRHKKIRIKFRICSDF